MRLVVEKSSRVVTRREAVRVQLVRAHVRWRSLAQHSLEGRIDDQFIRGCFGFRIGVVTELAIVLTRDANRVNHPANLFR